MNANDPENLRIEFQKADALRELRPHLDDGVGAASEIDRAGAVMRYLSRIVYAHLGLLLESYPLPSDTNIEEFTDSAIREAQEYANNAVVAKIARDARIYLVDACRVSYLGALAVRKAPFGSRPSFASMDYDGDCEKWSRAACERFLARFRTPLSEKAMAAVRSATSGGQNQDARRVVTQSRSVGKGRKVEPRTVERLKLERAELLADYKAHTGLTDWAIYSCAGPGTHSCHKPQFYQWKELLPTRQSAVHQSRNIPERTTASAPSSHGRLRNLPVLPRSTYCALPHRAS